MLKNYMSITLRLLIRNRSFSAVNIIGLGVGFATFLLICSYVYFEASYDHFHENGDDVYRVTVNYTNADGMEEHHAGIAIPLGPTLAEASGEVLNQSRMFNMLEFSRSVILGPADEPDKTFHEEEAYFVDPSFLEIFSYRVLEGSDEPLSVPNSMVITESTAEKYFGSADPLGQALVLNSQYQFTVTAVVEDVPEHSHQRFDILFSIEDGAMHGLFFSNNLHLYGDIAHTYLQVQGDTDVEELETRITRAANQLTDRKFEDVRLHLQPIFDIHLHSGLTGEMQQNGSAALVYSLGIFAFVTLLLAWANYINMAVARSSRRTKEIGIRKTLGAGRSQILILFLLEASLLNIAAILLALGLTEFFHPFLQSLLGYPLPSLFSLPLPVLILLSAVILAGTGLTGILPAILMWSLHPVMALKGKFMNVLSGVRLRYGLVTLQLTCVFILLAVSFGIYQQVNYMLTKDLEVDVNQVLVVRGPGIFSSPEISRGEAYQRFVSGYSRLKSELEPHTAISSVTSSNFIPGDRIDFQATLAEPGSDSSIRLVERIFVNYDFPQVYGLDMIAGRYYEESRNDQDQTLVLNESAARILGFNNSDDAVGRQIHYFGEPREVIGIVKDFHFKSLHHAVTPLVFVHNIESRFISIKLGSEQIQETMASVQEEWNESFPTTPFEYFFADEHFNHQYQNVTSARVLVSGITVLALMIACIGLFGLAYERVTVRLKEISIRKILGASFIRILGSFYYDFLYPVLISFLIAIPASWFLLHKWVTDFAYRITIGWEIYLIVGAIGLTVGIITVTWQSVRAASVNPAESLRSE